MHRLHDCPFHTHTRQSRPSDRLFTPQSRSRTQALSLQKALLDELLDNLDTNKPIHIDENNEWSVS